MALPIRLYPIIYKAKYQKDGSWTEEYIEKAHTTLKEESEMSPETHEKLYASRGDFNLPGVSATSNYGYGVFEGGKAFPREDGTTKVFRPDENAARMVRSMKGVYMTPPEAVMIENAMRRNVGRNAAVGFLPAFDKKWIEHDFLNAKATYIRPFTFGEESLAPEICHFPWIGIACMEVGSYYGTDAPAPMMVTSRIRAYKGGTGSFKCGSNYIASVMAKKDAADQGCVECLFLDAEEQKYIEEGSSSNVFCLLRSGELVTPELGDTILPGINRKSIIQLAKDNGIWVTERKISIDELLAEATECFVTGTAAAITHISSLLYKEKTTIFGTGKRGEVTAMLSKAIRSIQYGVAEDKYGWMKDVLL